MGKTHLQIHFARWYCNFIQQMSAPRDWELETTIVTPDMNEVMVEWIIQFRIDNDFDYLYKVRNPDAALCDISEPVMCSVVGDRAKDEVPTIIHV